MKRDMELIRRLLMSVEGEEPTPDLTGYTEEQRVYHMALLIEAGLLDGTVRTNSIGYPDGYRVRKLTWAGHEFLDAARDDTIWRKAKTEILKPAASWTFGLVLEWLKAEAKKKLNGDSGAVG